MVHHCFDRCGTASLTAREFATVSSLRSRSAAGSTRRIGRPLCLQRQANCMRVLGEHHFTPVRGCAGHRAVASGRPRVRRCAVSMAQPDQPTVAAHGKISVRASSHRRGSSLWRVSRGAPGGGVADAGCCKTSAALCKGIVWNFPCATTSPCEKPRLLRRASPTSDWTYAQCCSGTSATRGTG